MAYLKTLKIMEKQEKIEQKKQQNIRSLLGGGCLFVVVSLLLLLSSLPSDNEESSSSTTTTTKRDGGLLGLKRFSREKLRKIQELIGKEDPPIVVKEIPPQPVPVETKELVQQVHELDQEVRRIKATGVLMEVDPEGLAASQRLQDATRLLLKARYGPEEPYRVKVNLRFQPSNPTFESMGPTDSFVIELAPSSLQPHSIFSFLEIARHWSFPGGGGAFHRRAGHVLQAMVHGGFVPHLAFQEYSPDYPHKKGTVGYAGRPSGPEWYVSIQDNSRNHGPGSQQEKNPYEADSCFGKIVEGFDTVIINRVAKMPGKEFLPKPAHVFIESMTILVLQGNEYVEWHPTSAVF